MIWGCEFVVDFNEILARHAADVRRYCIQEMWINEFFCGRCGECPLAEATRREIADKDAAWIEALARQLEEQAAALRHHLEKQTPPPQSDPARN